MSKVFFDVAVSLDGYLAGPNAGPKSPIGDGGPALHAWMIRTRAFREHLSIGEGGEEGEDDRLVRATFARIGANVMGKRMFDEGAVNWPQNAPFHTPVFVLTHEKREPWERPGGTTFYFVNDGIEAALRRAREVCGGKTSGSPAGRT